MLRTIRLQLGYTQKEFAQILDTTVTTVSRWENSGKEPVFRIRQIKALHKELKRLRIDLSELPDELANNGVDMM
jgi:transcriptional regulator with XRE-family HTH domain